MPEERPSQIEVILPHLSRWRSLKQYLPLMLWFIAGVVLQIFQEKALFPLWMNYAVRPIFRWAYSLVRNPAAQQWILYVLYLVEWAVAILAGVIGGLVIKRHVLRDLFSLAFGFALPPLLFFAYDNFKIPGLDLITEHGFVILLTVCSGMLIHHLKNRFTRKSSPATSSN